MQIAIESTPIVNTKTATFSRNMPRTGHAVSALPVLFLLVDAVMKLFKPDVVVAATTELGYQERVIVPLGIVLLTATVLYIIPRTAILGAVLLTGYLGGAVATHVRVDGGAFPILFPVIVGGLLWLGLYLRDSRVRAFIRTATVEDLTSRR